MHGSERENTKTWSLQKFTFYFFFKILMRADFYRGLFLFEGYRVTVVMLLPQLHIIELSHALKTWTREQQIGGQAMVEPQHYCL